MLLPRELLTSFTRLTILQSHRSSISNSIIKRTLSTATTQTNTKTTTNLPNKKLKYFVSASFHPKPSDPESPTNFQKKSAKKLIQGYSSDSPIAKWRDEILLTNPQGGGHDFYFVERHAESAAEGDVTIGIADGVGGWEDSGVNPAFFSQTLMYYSKEAVKARDKSTSPLSIMERGFEGVTNEKEVVAGSSTACIATLESATGILQAANLGDSTFYLIRNDKVIHSQKSQTHYFNAPFQLEKLPDGPRDSRFAAPDLPKDSDLFQTDLEEGDIFILTTDGFSDNVWPQELSQIITLVKNDSLKLDSQALITKIASTCVNYARICSFKEDKQSPFEYEAKTHKYDLRGGKVDDVTVVAVLVKA